MSKKAEVHKSGEEKEPTPQELKAMRDNLIKYYKEQNEVLILQDSYENYQANIAQNRVRALDMRMRLAHMLTPEADKGDGKRKLKTDT